MVNPGFEANGGEGELPPPAIGQSGGRGEGQGIPGSDQKHDSDLIGQSEGTEAGESPIRLAEREEGREEMAAGGEPLREDTTVHVAVIEIEVAMMHILDNYEGEEAPQLRRRLQSLLLTAMGN